MSASASLLALWRADLVATDALPRRPAWLDTAYRSPVEFWEKLASELIAAAPGVPRSAVFEWYNLFHELGERHAVRGRAMHIDYNQGSGFREESYAALTERARVLAKAWRNDGVVPGAPLCIVLNLSAAYVTCVLAAFYCGATLSIVPPEGPDFVRRALQAVIGPPPPKAPPGAAPQPVFVVAGTQAKPWVSGLPALRALRWEPDPVMDMAAAFEPHRYDANAAAVRLFSPLSAEWDVPVPLCADQLYLSALRDGVLLLGLEPGQRVSAPGFCEVQYKPGLLFATLAAGATWVEISLDESDEGRVLFAGNVDVLGVCDKVRKWVKDMQLPARPQVTRWFRSLAEENEAVRAWAELEAVMAGTGALGLRWLANSAAGGSIMFSAWSPKPACGGTWLTPGLPCELKEPNGTGMSPLSDVALLCPTAQPMAIRGALHQLTSAALGRPVIARTEDSDIWVLNLGSHRRATVLPERQIEEILQKEHWPAIRAAVLVALPRQGEGNAEKVALLVYVRPDSGAHLRAEDLKALLDARLGPIRSPDRVELFRLNPKLLASKKAEREIDRAGCAAQFISGTLWGKQQHRVFSELAALWIELERIARHDRDRASEEAGRS